MFLIVLWMIFLKDGLNTCEGLVVLMGGVWDDQCIRGGVM
jgi:hypothetical protein